MVDQLLSHGIGLLFCIGGDGTLRGAMEIANEVKWRTLPIGIIGIPKTIDNSLASSKNPSALKPRCRSPQRSSHPHAKKRWVPRMGQHCQADGPRFRLHCGNRNASQFGG